MPLSNRESGGDRHPDFLCSRLDRNEVSLDCSLGRRAEGPDRAARLSESDDLTELYACGGRQGESVLTGLGDSEAASLVGERGDIRDVKAWSEDLVGAGFDRGVDDLTSSVEFANQSRDGVRCRVARYTSCIARVERKDGDLLRLEVGFIDAGLLESI